jgi:bile acid:Na+ symporter, BASS family
MKKSFALLGAIVLGAFFPFFSKYSFLIQWLLMGMLFFSFLNLKTPEKMLREKSVLLILLANVLVGVFAYIFLSFFDRDLAIVAFLLGAMPTATAVPAVISFLRGNAEFAMASVLLTNIFMAFFWPLFFLTVFSIQIPPIHLFISIISVVLFPFFIAKAFQLLFPLLAFSVAKNGMKISFLLWILVVFLAVANASSFLFSDHSGVSFSFFRILFLAGFLCALHFWLGRVLGGKSFALEASQSMGQKNTMFSLWVALQFFSPLIALGPIFYLIFHNLYNSYSLFFAHRSRSV